jgi:hypothetical protein
VHENREDRKEGKKEGREERREGGSYSWTWLHRFIFWLTLGLESLYKDLLLSCLLKFKKKFIKNHELLAYKQWYS